MPFFAERLHRQTLKRKHLLNNTQVELIDESQDFENKLYFEDLKKQISEEISKNSHRLVFRRKYNLCPKDERYLSMSDEEIMFDLMLDDEYNKQVRNQSENEYEEHHFDASNPDVFESDEPEYNDLVDRMESGEDFDLESLMSNKDWEEV